MTRQQKTEKLISHYATARKIHRGQQTAFEKLREQVTRNLKFEVRVARQAKIV